MVVDLFGAAAIAVLDEPVGRRELHANLGGPTGVVGLHGGQILQSSFGAGLDQLPGLQRR